MVQKVAKTNAVSLFRATQYIQFQKFACRISGRIDVFFFKKLENAKNKSSILHVTGNFLKLYVSNLRSGDRRAHVNVNTTRVKKAVSENPNIQLCT